jgi:hypothetical protein
LILAAINFNSSQNKSYVLIDNKKYYVDVARTQIEQGKGLAIYEGIPQDKGMIFPFSSPDYYTFWMKDMRFPIDIIYINRNKIVDIFNSVPAPKSENQMLPIYRPKEKADMVLEINAGQSKKYNFKIGDVIKINY